MAKEQKLTTYRFHAECEIEVAAPDAENARIAAEDALLSGEVGADVGILRMTQLDPLSGERAV